MNYYLDEGAKAPTRAHNLDAGLDLYAYKFLHYQSEKVLVVRPDTTYLIDTGLHLAIPAGYCGLVLPRSSSARDGLLVHTGVIDSGYTGSIKITVNALNEAKLVRLNDRIAQLLIIPIPTFELKEVETLSDSERGTNGFGSTGV
ncbi:MAG: dUTP diphosphatase [Succinivibrio sp.]|nr:dUTP diphosphatase [Succinivibrio sp.]